MANNNLKIDLHSREDKDGRIFYVGKLKCPAMLTLKEGVTFLIFVSESGAEQLQIANMDNKDDD
jgi:hypothetical protein